MLSYQKAATRHLEWDSTGIMAGVIIAAVSVSAALTKWVIMPIWKSVGKPSIKFTRGPNAIDGKFQNEETWRFVSIGVKNRKNEPARRCVATAKIIKQPDNVVLAQQDFSLHWADVPLSGQNAEADPVDIAGVEQRLYIAFTTPDHSKMSSVAMPAALGMSGQAPQANLPGGEYILQINISCDNGSGDEMKIKLISPDHWQDLHAEKVK